MSDEDGIFTKAELATIADSYFERRSGACPRDGTGLAIEELGYLGRRTLDLFARCPRCGRTGEYEGAEPSNDIEPWDWDPDDRAVIVDEYWKTRRPRCPLDRSLLRVEESRELGRGTAGTPIFVSCPRCGRSFVSDEVQIGRLRPDTFEGRFAVVRPLSEGGMGKVSLVRERSTGALYVAKEIKPHVADAEGLLRFRREIRLLEGLAHPNIVRIVASYFPTGGALYVMEHLPGGHLESLINDKNVPAARVVALFAEAVAGVEHLHRKEIVHRDLKPRNILLGADERARIADLGLARDPDVSTLTRSGAVMGTWLYMAPEQKTGARVTPRADVYALALIAYEIATRKSPYSLLRLGSGPFWDLLARALEEDPDRRTVTPAELVEGLGVFVAGATSLHASGGSDLPTASLPANEEDTGLGTIEMGGDEDGALARLGYRRVGRGRPGKGDLYLGRGDGGYRGIYRQEQDPPPGGYSGADVFDILQRL